MGMGKNLMLEGHGYECKSGGGDHVLIKKGFVFSCGLWWRGKRQGEES